MKRPPGGDKLNRARGLRREMTPQEKILWYHLRGRRFEGFKFRRQMWLTGFIADFACPRARLMVEADGSQHAGRPAYDEARAAAFTRIGWCTLRFWNNEINENLEGVLTSIRAGLPPLPVGEREGPAAQRWEGEGQSRDHRQPLTRRRCAPPPSPLQGEG